MVKLCNRESVQGEYGSGQNASVHAHPVHICNMHVFVCVCERERGERDFANSTDAIGISS